MTGKVFSESADIYEDQAQVLFDYYRQAAERIVTEEMAIEQEQAACSQERQGADALRQSSHTTLIVWAVAAAVSLILVIFLNFIALLIVAGCGVMAFKQYSGEKSAQQTIAQCDQRLAELQEAHAAIRRDYRVQRIGVAYVPVARRIPYNDKSFVVDFTGEQPDTQFTLTVLNQPEELRGVMSDLHQHMEQMPAVESSDDVETVDTSDYSTSIQDVTLHDYMGTIDRQVRNVNYLVANNHDVSVSLPAVPPTSERYRFLSEHATTATSGHPVVPVFDMRPAKQKVEAFASLGALNQQSAQDGSASVDFFVDVMSQLAQGVDLLARSRTACVTDLTNYSSAILSNVLKASYDHYSPALEAEEIERIRNASFDYSESVDSYKPFALKESSRVRYDIFSYAWIADNGSRTSMPFGMHQVESEVLMPVIANLMQENRTERLRIYSDIQNQKTDYLNQWHRDTDDFYGRNRTEANALIQRMNEAYAEYVESYTNYQQQRATIEAMKTSGNLEDAEVAEADNQAEIIEGFQVQTAQARTKQDEFAAFMDRVREDIDTTAEQFGFVEYYEASLRDSQARANAQAAADVRNLEPRRRPLASVNPYLAQKGNVPPAPKVSERLNEDFTIDLTRQATDEIRALGNEGLAIDPASSSEEVSQ